MPQNLQTLLPPPRTKQTPIFCLHFIFHHNQELLPWICQHLLLRLPSYYYSPTWWNMPWCPGLLQPHTAFPLISMSRLDHFARIPNDIFNVAMRRKLQIPIFDVSFIITCKCTQYVDIYGDHFFCCEKNSKKLMHDNIRDCSEIPVSSLLHEAKIIASPKDYSLELEHILSIAPNMRP